MVGDIFSVIGLYVWSGVASAQI